MTICVIMDSDGHFDVAQLDKRKDVIKLLKKVEDGDYWANSKDDNLDDVFLTKETELLTADEDTWVKFVHNFQQRGTFEIITIK